MTDKLKTWFTALPLSLFVLNAAVANEANTNEHKDNGTGHTISNADDVRHTDSNTGIDVDTVAETGDQPQKMINDNSDYFEQMQQRRREVQQAQREAYLRHLERRAQQAPADYPMPKDTQQRRELFIKQMEERRQMAERIRNEYRKAAEMRRKERLQKMNQTSTKSASADKA